MFGNIMNNTSMGLLNNWYYEEVKYLKNSYKDAD